MSVLNWTEADPDYWVSDEFCLPQPALREQFFRWVVAKERNDGYSCQMFQAVERDPFTPGPVLAEVYRDQHLDDNMKGANGFDLPLRMLLPVDADEAKSAGERLTEAVHAGRTTVDGYLLAFNESS